MNDQIYSISKFWSLYQS